MIKTLQDMEIRGFVKNSVNGWITLNPEEHDAKDIFSLSKAALKEGALVIFQPAYARILSLAPPTYLPNGQGRVQTESVSTVYRIFGCSLQDRLGFSPNWAER